MATTINGLNLSLSPFDEAWQSSALRGQWEAMFEGADNLNLVYASADWCEHSIRTSIEQTPQVAVLHDASEQFVGLAPLLMNRFVMQFDVFNRVLAKATLRSAQVLGSLPLLPPQEDAYRSFFNGLFRTLDDCDCIYMDCVPTQSFLWQFLQATSDRAGDYLVYLPEGVRPWHWLELANDFDAYMAGMSGKARQTLRRKVKAFTKQSGGTLDFRRIESEDEVGEFLKAAAAAGEGSWQHRLLGPRVRHTPEEEEKLKDLARRKILRAYLLTCGGVPCAFLIGHQFRGVFQYDETAFDESFTRLSPGTVLLYLVIEDLHRHNRPAVLNFGAGDGVHKRRFANRSAEDATVVLLRKTLVNRLRVASHLSLRSAVRLAKWLVRRRVTK